MNYRIENLIDRKTVENRIKELAKQIEKDYAGEEVYCVGLLKGSVVFLSDLVKEINSPVIIDFMSVSSYGSETVSSGDVKILKDTDLDLRGKHVLIVEDIIDTGLTLEHVIRYFKESKGVKTLKTCTLLSKPERRKVNIDIDYVGFDVPDKFVIGYGLDYDQKYRNLPYIAVVVFEEEPEMDFKHKKKYGQNFLNNKDEILNKIIEVSNIDENDEILEIGPGQGALTNLLVERVKKLTCVEIDKDLEAGLRKKFSSKENYTLVMGDVLEVDLTKYLNKGTKVVANIPYYITSPIINKLIENKELIDEAYIMVQKEVGERICAKAGKERSILTLAVEYYGEADYLFTIPREFFNPVPNVDSAFISIKFYKDDRYKNKISEDLFFKYIKAAFSNKRKNIVNNLATLGYSKDKIKEILNQVEISENERAENISIDKFIELIDIFEGR